MIDNSVVALKDYGQIVFHVKDMMDKQTMTRGKLAKLANIRFEVANKWYHGKVERIDADVLARICFALDCRVQDIMTHEKMK